MIVYPPVSMDLFEPVETQLLLRDESGGTYHPKGYLVPPGYLTGNIRRGHPLWHHLVDRLAGKKQQRVFVPELEYVAITPENLKDIKLAYLGTNNNNTVYVRNKGKPDVKYLAPSSGGIPNSELAREYLRVCLEAGAKDRKIMRCPSTYQKYLKIPATLYYEGGRSRGNYSYVDISQAYWTLHRTATIDTRFETGQWRRIAMGDAPYLDTGEVSDYRELRHLIPGCVATGAMQEARYGSIRDCEFKGGLFFPGVIGYGMSVMHAIAREVIDHFGAVMILTDAYIVPQDKGQCLIDFLQERWGVQAVIKDKGPGAVYDQGCYAVGRKRSGDAPRFYTDAPSWTYTSSSGTEMIKVSDGKPNSTLIDVDSIWLQKERRIIMSRGLGEGSLCDTE